MIVVTASWFDDLPPGFTPVGISRGVPRGYGRPYRRFGPLAPTDLTWSARSDPRAFSARYRDQLQALDADEVRAALAAMGDRLALVCWERVAGGSWCHRSLAAEWLGVDEIGHQGRRHPLLPPEDDGQGVLDL